MYIEKFKSTQWKEFVKEYFKVAEKDDVRIVMLAICYDDQGKIADRVEVKACIDVYNKNGTCRTKFVSIDATDSEAIIKLDANFRQVSMEKYRSIVTKVANKYFPQDNKKVEDFEELYM